MKPCILDPAMNEWCRVLEEGGFAIARNVFTDSILNNLIEHIADPALRRSRAGIRHALGVQAIAAVARDSPLIEMARAILGREAVPFRATLFDKSPLSNWLV